MSGVMEHSGSAKPDLEAFIRRIQDISTIPQIAIQVLKVANDPLSGAGDLKNVMETDAALSARTLRCVNSSAYAVRTKITNLQQAIAYLGLKQIRNIALTASVAEMFREDSDIQPYSRTGLWRHLVSVGICARLIAMRRKVANFEDAFLAGLLHDIGIILIDQNAPKQFRAVIEHLSPEHTLCETERQYVGFDHCLVGEELAKKWGFPSNVRAAICYHHGSQNYRGEDIDIVRCVEVANLICTLKGISSVGMKLLKVPAAAFKGLELTKSDIAVLAEDLENEISQNAGLFQL